MDGHTEGEGKLIVTLHGDHSLESSFTLTLLILLQVMQ